MQLGELDFRRQSHPVDVIETVASHHDWSFERPCDDEIAVSVQGAWTDYSVSFSWMEASEALHLGCAFALKIPARRQVETMRLLSRINEQLLLGHFDIWAAEGAVMFRHAMLLSGGVQPTSQQASASLGGAGGLRALLSSLPVRGLGRQGRRGGAGLRRVRHRGQRMTKTIAPVGRLLLLGGGNMGGAMLRGWMESGLDPASVTIVDPSPSAALSTLFDRGCAPCDERARRSPGRRDLAVKPQVLARPSRRCAPR